MTTMPISIEEINGKRRTLILRERSLPYKGASFVNGSHKIEITYFPGNPVAHSQVLGPEYGGTVLSGWWKDKFVRDPENAPVANRFPQVTAYGAPPPPSANLVYGNTFASSGIFPGGAQLLQRSATIRDAFELIKNSGAKVRLEWQDVARFGHLTRAEFKEHNGAEVEYEIEFRWTGTTDAQPKVVKASFKAKGLLDTVLGFIKSIDGILATQNYTFKIYIGRYASQVASLVATMNGLTKTLSGFLDLQRLGGEIVSGIKSSCYSLRDNLLALLELWDEDDNRLSSGRRNVGETQFASLMMAELRKVMLILAEEIAQQLALLEEQTARTTQQIYTVSGLKSLRDIALDVYGTPDPWRQIMFHNNLSSSFVSSGDLKIPKLGA